MFKTMPGVSIVDVASNGEEAMQVLNRNNVDVVVTDLQMPVMDGFGLIENMKQLYPFVKIVVLTMHDDIWRIKKLLRMGVNAILSKSAGDKEMQEAIDAVYDSRTYYDAYTKEIVLGILTNEDNSEGGANNVSFTDREVLILQHIYEGLTTNEIAERMKKSKHTIDTHRRNMFLKCKVNNIAGLIKYGIQKGYLDPS